MESLGNYIKSKYRLIDFLLINFEKIIVLFLRLTNKSKVQASNEDKFNSLKHAIYKTQDDDCEIFCYILEGYLEIKL